MRIGIFAKTFARPTLAATLDAVGSHGIDCVQFNLACAGLPSLPERIDPEFCRQIQDELEARGIAMAAVSGTCNLIHPDLQQRRDGLRRLGVLIQACPALGTRIVTLCTGTRDPDDPWRRHPDNDSTEAWRDLIASLRTVLPVAEEAGVTLAFEPEVANVVDSARKGRWLLDEIASPHLKVVLDAANLLHAGALARMEGIIAGACALLGPDIVLAHAKDLSRDGEAGHEAAGTGLLDYHSYLARLREAGFDGHLILHGLAEAQVDTALTFLRDKLARLGMPC
jgi:sugar phosphate isomerase/epimerase